MPLSVTVTIMPRAGVLDPQGKAIEATLGRLGEAGIASVRQGKVIMFTIDETETEAARTRVERMCETLLANPVIEDWEIALAPTPDTGAGAAA